MATWAKGVSFKNSDNTKNIGGVGIYGNDTTAEKLYIGLGTEPWNNAGLQLTNSAINFKGNKIYHAGDKPSLNDIGAAAASHTHSILTGINDTRTTDYTPDTAKHDFKVTFQWSGSNDLNDGGNFYSLMHIPRWADASGGFGSQVAFTDNENIWHRKGTSDTTWSQWNKIWHSGNFNPDIKFQSGGTYGTLYLTDWFRAKGNTGLYFQDYGGGWYMTDSTWVRSYAGKNIYTDGIMNAKNGFQWNGQSLDSRYAAATHSHSYLPLSGGTLTGAVTFANNTYNIFGDDVALGDCNQAGKIGIKGLNGETGIYFYPQSGSVPQTISIDGTGSLTISGTTKGNFNGSLTGNASTATKLQTARTINGVSFDGSQNITIKDSTKLNYGYHSSAQDCNNIKTTGVYSCQVTMTNAATTTHGTLIVDFSVGTPYQIWIPDNSNIMYKRNYTPSSSSWGSWSSTLGNSISGNASTATKLTASKTIALSGDAIGSASFDGSANATINATVRKTCFVGSDAENTAGWYKVASQTMSGYGDTNITFTVTSTYANYHSGILQLQIRADNTSITCKTFAWHTRIGLSPSDYIVNISGMTWTLYAYQNCTRYGRLMFEVMSQSSINDKNSSFVLHNTSTKESAKPTVTVTSSDASTVATANTLTTARTLTIGKTGKAFNGSANVSWTTDEIGALDKFNDSTLASDKKIFLGHSGSWITGSSNDGTVNLEAGGNLTLRGDRDCSNATEFVSLKAGNNDLKVTSSGTGTGQDKLTFNGNIVYHAGRKPTVAEIGAAASSHTHNSIMHTNEATASITTKDHGDHTWFRNSSGMWTFQSGTNGDDWTQSFQFNLMAADNNVNSKWMELGQQKSNVADGKYRGVSLVKFVGSKKVAGDLSVGDILGPDKTAFRLGTDSWLRINDTNSYSSGVYLGTSNVRTDGRFEIVRNNVTWKVTNDNGSFTHYRTTAPEGHWFDQNIRVAGEIYASAEYNKRVYHEGYKPSASDIGAAASNHNHTLISLSSQAFDSGNDLNTYNSNKMWVGRTTTTSTNRPTDYFTIFNIGAEHSSNFQLGHSYANVSAFYVRGRHDTSGAYTPWARVYTTQYKPTASDIGAAATDHNHDSSYLKSTGGTMTGNLTLRLSGGTLSGAGITTGNTQLIGTDANTIYFGNPKTKVVLESSSNPNVSVNGTTYTMYHTGNKPSYSDIGAAKSDHTHSNYVPTSEYGLTTISKTLTIGTSWMDTGITGTNLANGSYMVQVSGMSSSATSFYSEIWTGVMSWYSADTNSTDSDEIVLHKAGHASNGRTIYLRTLRVAGNKTLKLQICASTALNSTNVIFKFRKLI